MPFLAALAYTKGSYLLFSLLHDYPLPVFKSCIHMLTRVASHCTLSFILKLVTVSSKIKSYFVTHLYALNFLRLDNKKKKYSGAWHQIAPQTALHQFCFLFSWWLYSYRMVIKSEIRLACKMYFLLKIIRECDEISIVQFNIFWNDQKKMITYHW